MEEDPPDVGLVEVGRYGRLSQARERGLVLSAMEVPHWIIREKPDFVLRVEAAHQARAMVELEKYEVEAREREQTNRNTSYDQLQEDLSALRVELAAVKKADSEEIAAVRSELAEVKKSAAEETQGVRRGLALSQRRERILEGHVWDLRRHIERGEGPPPPPYPPELEIPA